MNISDDGRARARSAGRADRNRRVRAENRRWRIANWLNRFSRFCWPDLVSWAIDGELFKLTQSGRGSDCRAESVTHRDRSCWCTKFENGTRKDSA